MARALTGPEIAYLQDERQRTDLFLAVLVPEVVFTARVVGAHEADRLAVIEYNLGSGAGDFANVLADMTLYVGSTAGDFDRGMARLRQVGDDLVNDWYEPGSGGITGDMRIGETSEIDIQAGDYLTVVDEFQLWARPLRITGAGVIYMDYEVPYIDEHQYPQPVPVMGPHACAWLPAGGMVDVLFDAGDSWSPIVPGVGYTFAWTCAGAAIAGGATATPTITFNATGTYRVSCAVTADYGGGNTAVFTGYRRVFVFDDDNMPLVKFTLDDCSGSWREGGWSFRVTMYEEALLYDPATVTGIRDRALVVLFARDWYGDTEVSIGPIQTGATTIRGNVIASGWITGESITRNWEQGTVGFEVQGPQHWIGQMTGFPSGLRDTDAPGGPGTPPLDWPDFDDLTVDGGLWHFLHWRSTVTRCMDFRASSDVRQTAYFDAPIGTLWEQLRQTAENVIFAYPVCDRYARLFIEVNSQLLPTADRVGIPVVMPLTTADWRRRVDIRRHTVSKTGLADLSGVFYLNGVAAALFSLAHGHIFKHYGGVRKSTSRALASQAQSNVLAGLVLSNDNNEYPHVDIPLRANNRNIDVAPWQYVTMSIAPGDTERGITWTNKKLVPRQVSFQMQQGMLLADIEAEAWTDEVDSTDGDVPPEPPPPSDPPPPPPPPPPPVPPEPPKNGLVLLNEDQVAIAFDADFVTGVAPTWADLDPNADLVGIFQSIAARGIEGWITTRDDGDKANTGLWYCSDTSAGAGVAWTLIKSANQAEADTGYTGTFGSVYVGTSGVWAALFHVPGNAVPDDAGPQAILRGTGNSGTWHDMPIVAAQALFQRQPFDGTLHSVWVDGAGVVYICCGNGATNRPHVVYGTGAPFIEIDFTGFMWGYTQACFDGEVMGYNGIGPTSPDGISTYSGWSPANTECNQDVYLSTGIFSESGQYLVTRFADNDLYEDCLSKIGDAPDEFGVGRVGGMAMYLRGDDDHIVWVCGNPAIQASADLVLVYTPDAGANWVDWTGNLYAILGADWTGWTGGSTGNSIVRIFEY